MKKLKDYLRQSDFEEYFRPNRTGEDEFVREKLVENDFEIGILPAYLGWILIAILFIKGFLFVFGKCYRQAFLLLPITYWCYQILKFDFFSRILPLE